MALIDEVVIFVQAGAGGNGCVSFRREKYIPFGGPNGGNGGKGGDVILRATRDKTSLLDFKYKPKFQAERGEHGMGNDCFGHAGEDLLIEVPTGTLVYDNDTQELLCDLIKHGETYLVAQGGRGGRGNLSFKSSTNRAPRQSTPGEPGIEKNLKLELQVLADIGLIGLPNAGKSSFLASVSRAKPKIANYPFTTLEPNLGVVEHKNQGFVLADLPGLIEGASEGAGLGIKFLKHISRNRMLLHFVDINASPAEIEKNIKTVRKELEAYSKTLAKRPEVLVFTKIDLLTEAALKKKKDALSKRSLKGHYISSHTHQGVEKLLDKISAKKAQNWGQK